MGGLLGSVVTADETRHGTRTFRHGASRNSRKAASIAPSSSGCCTPLVPYRLLGEPRALR